MATTVEALAGLAPAAAGFADEVLALLAELREHIDKENVGVFPVAVVSLDGTGWETVSRAHAEQPSFLTPGHYLNQPPRVCIEVSWQTPTRG